MYNFFFSIRRGTFWPEFRRNSRRKCRHLEIPVQRELGRVPGRSVYATVRPSLMFLEGSQALSGGGTRESYARRVSTFLAVLLISMCRGVGY